MEIILLERIEKLGQMGDVVTVKGGFARNYLLPQKKALRATKENLAIFETQRQQLEAENLQRKDEAQQVADKLDGLKIVVIRSAGESGQLYGSVNARDIAATVTEAGFTIQRNQVVLERPVKALGLFDVRVRLHPEVSATVTANVARSEDEAAEQERLGRAIVTADMEDQETEAEAAMVEAEAIFEPEAVETAQANLAEGEGDSTDEAAATAETAAPETATDDSDEKAS